MSAIVRFDEDGEIQYFVTEDTHLFIVDERCTHDRVYKYGTNATSMSILKMLGGSEVGHSGDARHAAVSARIIAFDKGERHLKPVDPDTN